MSPQRRLFGTDGIRGTANTDPMTAETALRLGQAAGLLFTRGAHRHRVVIGKDTRLSGYLIEPALVAGFIGAGMDVRAGRPAADAGDRDADPQPARRPRRDDLRQPQPVRGQRHQAVRSGRLQAVRRDRGGDRGADGRRPLGAARRAGAAWPGVAARGRRRALYRGGEVELPARAAARRAEDRRRLRQRRRLSRRAHGAVGTRRRGDLGRGVAGRVQHQPRLRLDGAEFPVRRGAAAWRRPWARARRRRRPADPVATSAADIVDGDQILALIARSLGRRRAAARRRRRRDRDVQPRAGAVSWRSASWRCTAPASATAMSWNACASSGSTSAASSPAT